LVSVIVTHRLRERVAVQLDWAIEVIPTIEVSSISIAEVPPRPVPIQVALLNALFGRLVKPSGLDRITPDLVDGVTDLHECIGSSVSLSGKGLHLREQLHKSIEKQISATATVFTQINDEFLLVLAYASAEEGSNGGL
jgi:hypothetical protein